MSVPAPVALAGVPAEPTVVIADDQALVRAGFRMILAEAGRDHTPGPDPSLDRPFAVERPDHFAT